MLTNYSLSTATNSQYKYPLVFLGLYVTSLLTTVCLANKIIIINQLLLPGGIFLFTFTFCICDIVGEVYGYSYPRFFIWIGVIAEFIFSLVTVMVSHIGSPEYCQYSKAYQEVFDPTIRYVISGVVALLVGEFLNVYLLSKWKVFLRGKYFIFRSILSTALGQASLTIIVDILNYTGKIPTKNLIWMMIYGYTWKMVFTTIFVFPAWLFVNFLKKIEKIDYYDVHTNFSPFVFGLPDPSFSKNN